MIITKLQKTCTLTTLKTRITRITTERILTYFACLVLGASNSLATTAKQSSQGRQLQQNLIREPRKGSYHCGSMRPFDNIAGWVLPCLPHFDCKCIMHEHLIKSSQ